MRLGRTYTRPSGNNRISEKELKQILGANSGTKNFFNESFTQDVIVTPFLEKGFSIE